MIETIRNRVSSVCVSLSYGVSQVPFSFDLQPTGSIDRAFRIESQQSSVIGGFNYSEERTDNLTIWVARKYAGDAQGAYQLLLKDVNSLRAAVIRDGAQNGGDYIVPDGGGYQVQRNAGQEYAVLRLTLPVNFEATV